jgi:hypothetical protein
MQELCSREWPYLKVFNIHMNHIHDIGGLAIITKDWVCLRNLEISKNLNYI